MLPQGNDGHVSINSARDSTSTSLWHLAEEEKTHCVVLEPPGIEILSMTFQIPFHTFFCK